MISRQCGLISSGRILDFLKTGQALSAHKNIQTILISHSQPDDWDSLMQTSTSYKVSMVKTLTEGATVVKLE